MVMDRSRGIQMRATEGEEQSSEFEQRYEKGGIDHSKKIISRTWKKLKQTSIRLFIFRAALLGCRGDVYIFIKYNHSKNHLNK